MENGGSDIVVLIQLSLVILMIVSLWRTFSKAGEPGWACIIPIYNMYVLLKIAGRPGWWLLLLFIPIVNIVINAIVDIDVARNFGKGLGFGIGLFFLPIIFFPILAFGNIEFAK